VNAVPDLFQLASERLARDGEAWVRNVLARSALDFSLRDARLPAAPGRRAGDCRGAGEVGRVAQIEAKGRK
jgi:hypothetical protein